MKLPESTKQDHLINYIYNYILYKNLWRIWINCGLELSNHPF